MSRALDTMPPRSMPAPAYSRGRMGLHWLIALLIFTTFPLGLYMHDMALTPNKLRLFSYHKWIGVSIFLLALARVWARAMDGAIFARPVGPRWQHAAADAVHLLLYVLIIVVPLSGWVLSSAEGFQTVWFGVLPLPDLVAKNKELANALKELHKVLNFVMLGIVVVHVLAALQHHFLLRDGVLHRMLPGRR
ncbi:MAG: cytochrome b [Caldimonas sp.]